MGTDRNGRRCQWYGLAPHPAVDIGLVRMADKRKRPVEAVHAPGDLVVHAHRLPLFGLERIGVGVHRVVLGAAEAERPGPGAPLDDGDLGIGVS